MNDKLDKLFKAVRAEKPDTSRVEFGFETRLLARIRSEKEQESPWLVWAWKLMPAFAAVVLALGVWNVSFLRRPVSLETALLGGGEQQLLAGVFAGD